VVKTEIGNETVCFKRERSNYRLPAIISCQYIRTLYDVVGPEEDDAQAESALTTEDPPCMVFEWMEHDLRTVPSEQFRQNLHLPKIVAKSVLSALEVLKTEYGAVHTGAVIVFLVCDSSMADGLDINPNNVFLSGINGPSPMVKVGDLGNSQLLPQQRYE